MNNIVVAEDIKNLAERFAFKKELQKKTVLVTGGTGLIGSLIVRFLAYLRDTEGVDVGIIAMARNPQKVKKMDFPSNIQWVFQDMREKLNIKENADYIFHTACPTQSQFLADNPVEVITSTVTGAENLFLYARERQLSVVYLSSIEIYGQMDSDCLVSEDTYGHLDHLNARSCYPESKKMIESLATAYAKEYGTDIKIARLTQTFGAGISKDDKRVFAQFARAAIYSQDIVLHTKGISSKSYVYTMDAINALFYIMLKGNKGEAYNVANEETFISIYGLAQFVIQNFNENINVRIDEKNMGYAPDTRVNLNTSKLKALGWKPEVGLEEAYRRMIQSMQEESTV